MRNLKGDDRMSLWVRIKKAWQDFLEKMAKDNEKAFGNGRLDCCQLNSKQKEKAR